MTIDPRFKVPTSQRRFGGKVFTFLIAGTKAESEKDADRFRAKGFSARIVPWRRKFAVYIRKGR